MSDKKEMALLLVLHGSPRPEANAPALSIAQGLRTSGKYREVFVAYLECNYPSIPEAIAECATHGIRDLIAVPYFLHSGRHQVLDVPQLLIEAAEMYPDLKIQITEPVGTSPLIADGLAQRAQEALVQLKPG